MGKGGFVFYNIGIFMNMKQTICFCIWMPTENKIYISRLNGYPHLGPSGLFEQSPHTLNSVNKKPPFVEILLQ